MTGSFRRRIACLKKYLRRLMASRKEDAYKVKLTRPTAKELREVMREWCPGVRFTNVARDIRIVTEAGETYDAEFDLLWRGLLLPEIVAKYSEAYLAKLVKNVIAPDMLEKRIAAEIRRRPDGRAIYEEV